MKRAVAITFAFGSMLVASACTLIADIHERDELPGSGGASSSASIASSSAGGAGGASSSSASSGGGGGATCPSKPIVCPNAIFVSPTGNDDHDGCTKDDPKQTLTAALAQGRCAQVPTVVRACVATYTEPTLTIDFGVSLLGGFSCQDFSPTGGLPTIKHAGGGISTVFVDTPLPTTIDSFIIDGPAFGATSTTTITLLIDGASTTKVENCTVNGGQADDSGSGTGTSAINIGSTAAPEIAFNTIDGGSGSAVSGSGSAGIIVATSTGAMAASIHDNVIGGGSGEATVNIGSVGILFAGGGPDAFTAANNAAVMNNVIDGGTGSSTDNSRGTAAIHVTSDVVLDLIGNTISGGVVSDASSIEGTVGVLDTGRGALTVTRNFIYGGESSATVAMATGGAGLVVGSPTQGPSSLLVFENEIHGGVVGVGPSNGLVVASLGAGAAPKILANTFIVGTATTASSGLFLESSVTGAVVDQNLFGANGEFSSFGLHTQGCARIGELSNNVFLALEPLSVTAPVESGCTAKGYTSLTNAIAALTSVSAAGDKLLASSCTTDGDCVVKDTCASNAACVTAAFLGWAGDGVDALLAKGVGWKLNPSGFCEVNTGGIDLSTFGTTDIFGVARGSSTWSVGAAQAVGSGTCH